MDMPKIRETILSQRFVRSGDRFGFGECVGAVNGLAAHKNEQVPYSDIEQAVGELVDAGLLQRDGSGYRMVSRNFHWLTRPWRQRSDAALGITDPSH